MSTFKFSELPVAAFRAGGERRIAYTDHLMLVIFDFSDGPQTQPTRRTSIRTSRLVT